MTKQEEVWTDQLMAGNVVAEEIPVTFVLSHTSPCNVFLFIMAWFHRQGLD